MENTVQNMHSCIMFVMHHDDDDDDDDVNLILQSVKFTWRGHIHFRLDGKSPAPGPCYPARRRKPWRSLVWRFATLGYGKEAPGRRGDDEP